MLLNFTTDTLHKKTHVKSKSVSVLLFYDGIPTSCLIFFKNRKLWSHDNYFHVMNGSSHENSQVNSDPPYHFGFEGDPNI